MSKAKNESNHIPYEGEGFEEQPLRSNYRVSNTIKVIVLCIFALILLFVVLLACGVIRLGGGKEYVTVPQIQGMTIEEATEALKNAGLNLIVTDGVNSNTGMLNTVLNQTPSMGIELVKGDFVSVSINIGRPDPNSNVPNLQYRSVDMAFSELHSLNYKVAIEVVETTNIMTGHVVSQNPAPGENLPEGNTVTLQVSTIAEKERIGIEHTTSDIDLKAAAVFMNNGSVMHVICLNDGNSLGQSFPDNPVSENSDLTFIGWSNEDNGLGGEFKNSTEVKGVHFAYAFFAKAGTTIATPTPLPVITFGGGTDVVTTSPSPTPTFYYVEPTPMPTLTPTVSNTPFEMFTEAPETTAPVATSTPTPTQTVAPTPTPQPPSLSISPDYLTLNVGDSHQLELKFGGTHSGHSIAWRSENESVATVNNNGVVKAVGAGTTTVYAFSISEGIEASCQVVVYGEFTTGAAESNSTVAAIMPDRNTIQNPRMSFISCKHSK